MQDGQLSSMPLHPFQLKWLTARFYILNTLIQQLVYAVSVVVREVDSFQGLALESGELIPETPYEELALPQDSKD
jgi:hypothetical protein